MQELFKDLAQATDKKAKSADVPKIEHDKHFAKLEEKMRRLQGLQNQRPVDLSIYAKVKMPKKFKMLEFEYEGTSHLKIHLKHIWSK